MRVLLGWALAVAAVIVAVIAARDAWRKNLQTTLLLAALEKCAARGQFERARKICNATRPASAGVVAGHAFGLRLEATSFAEGETGYRDAPAAIPFVERVRRALAPVVAGERAAIARVRRSAGGGLAGGVVALALARGAVAPMLVASAGLVASGLALWWARAVLRGLDLCLERLPLLVLPGDAMHQLDPPFENLALSISEPGQAERSASFGDDVIKIGREPGAGLRLSHAEVLRIHAVIENGAHGARLINLGGCDSTRVNGQPIASHALAAGDVIELGPCRLVVTRVAPR